MTIAGRNKARLAAIFIILFIFLIAAAAILSILTTGKLDSNEIRLLKNETVPASMLPEFLYNLQFVKYSPAAVCFGIFACSTFSLTLLIYIYFTFKKTHAIEISFFLVFIFSIGFESLRLIFPSYNFSGIALENIAFISRLVYFFRLAGIIALFISGIFAIKIITRQIFYVMFFGAFIAFSIVISIPVNNFAINKYFIADIKYSYSYTFIICAIAILACINYFFVYILKNSKEYLKASIMLTVITVGHWFLLYTSSFLNLIIGAALFLTGTVFYTKNIHNYHLWE
ncbi:hypothetical protein [Treponema pedis]|uniref:hypothetical protein n=1 Tax=Treponema pedis TaxID=409322 RepID=UPI00197EDCAF|nr:hypothetical protein [Treponema pedis]QSI04924.1 hypothetical protein DYQ05_08315 [Treponema pedis]